MNRKYVQLNLDLNKKFEKKYADFLEELNNKGISNKKALMLALDSLMEKEDQGDLKNIIKKTIKNENEIVVEEIKDLKLMIKALANNNLVTATMDNNDEIKTIEISDDEIDPAELNTF